MLRSVKQTKDFSLAMLKKGEKFKFIKYSYPYMMPTKITEKWTGAQAKDLWELLL